MSEFTLDELYGDAPARPPGKWQIDPAVQAERDVEAARILQQELADPRLQEPEVRAATERTLERVAPKEKPAKPVELNLEDLYAPEKPQSAGAGRGFINPPLPKDKTAVDYTKQGLRELATLGDMVISLPWGLASAAGGLGMYAEMQALGLNKRGAAEASREFGDEIAGAAPQPFAAVVRALTQKKGEEITPGLIENAMGKLMGWIEKGAVIVDKKTGGALTKDEVLMEANLLMNAIGAKAVIGVGKKLGKGGSPEAPPRVEPTMEPQTPPPASRAKADIEATTGITDVAARAKAQKQRRADARKAFDDDAAYADYLRNLVDEDIRMAQNAATRGERMKAAPGVTTPRTGSTDPIILKDGAVVDNSIVGQRTLDTALDKVAKGKMFDLTAEERIQLRGHGVRGGAKPELLAIIAGGAGALALSKAYPDKEVGENLLAAGLGLGSLGIGPSKTPLGGETFGTLLGKGQHTLRVLEQMNENHTSVPLKRIQEELRRPEVTKAEKDLWEAALAEITPDVVNGQPQVSAATLVQALREQAGEFVLSPRPVNDYADYGLQKIGRDSELVDNPFSMETHPQTIINDNIDRLSDPIWAERAAAPEGTEFNDFPYTPDQARREIETIQREIQEAREALKHWNPVVKPETIIWRTPRQTKAAESAQKHFNDNNYFAHSRHFVENGVTHVVEMQSDLVQGTKRPQDLPLEDRMRVSALEQQIQALTEELDGLYELPPTPEISRRRSEILDQRYELAEERKALLANGSTPELAPIAPMWKDWHKRIAREELALAARKGQEAVRFATADTVAKVEGWPLVTRQTDIPSLRTNLEAIRYDELMVSDDLSKLSDAIEAKDMEAIGRQLYAEPTLENARARQAQLEENLRMIRAKQVELQADLDRALKKRELREMEISANVYGPDTKTLDGNETYAQAIERLKKELGPDPAPAFHPQHQGIYDRYKKDVEKFLKQLGGKEVTDAKGHTWIEVATGMDDKSQIWVHNPGPDELNYYRGRKAAEEAFEKEGGGPPPTRIDPTEIRRTAEILQDIREAEKHIIEVREQISKIDAKEDSRFGGSLRREGLEEIMEREVASLVHLRRELRSTREIERLMPTGKPTRAQMFGRVEQNLLTLLATVGLGGALGYSLSEDGSLKGAIFGALLSGVFGTTGGRAALKKAIAAPDYALGVVSTRLGNLHPSLKRRLRDHELAVFKNLEKSNNTILPFLTQVGKLGKKAREEVSLAVYNRRPGDLAKHPKVKAVFPAVQKLLGELETELKSLGRFGEGLVDYFPRVVDDLEGLKTFLGKDYAAGIDLALTQAEARMIKKQGRGLTDVEKSLVVNRYLASPNTHSHPPGFAKPRSIPEVTKPMLRFYEPVDISLLRYTSGAINDIAKAKFFGKDLVTKKKNGRLYTDLDNSIGNLTSRLLSEGVIDQGQAAKLRSMLKARFEGGEKGMESTLAATRNLTNMALLGNVTAAATQIGDSLMVIYHFGIVPTVVAVAQKLIGKSKVTPKDLGLINHVAEELAEKGLTGKLLRKTLVLSGFRAIDMFAKGITLNAAMAEGRIAVRSPRGEAAFRARYGKAYGADLDQLIKDLKSGQRTPLTDSYAFSRLSDVQPVSKAEMPEAYLAHPNGRILYQLKTYLIKQTDVVRREAYQEIASGEPKRIARGVKNLLALGVTYALANIPGDLLKDIISGRPVELPDELDLLENVMQTFGVNRYTQDRLMKGKVVETAQQIVTPPVKVIQDIATGQERAASYAPILGRPIYDRALGGNEKREIAENRAKFGPGKPLSPEAKEYLRLKRKKEREDRHQKMLEAYRKANGL